MPPNFPKPTTLPADTIFNEEPSDEEPESTKPRSRSVSPDFSATNDFNTDFGARVYQPGELVLVNSLLYDADALLRADGGRPGMDLGHFDGRPAPAATADGTRIPEQHATPLAAVEAISIDAEVDAAPKVHVETGEGIEDKTANPKYTLRAPRKGNAMTCLPDSVLVLLHAKGIYKLSLLDLRKAMPAVGPAKFQDVSTILEAATEHTLERVSEEFKLTGGLELAVLQKSEDFLVLQVHANDNGAPSLSQTAHCMAYTGTYLIDNFSSNNVIQIEESDRKDKTSARAVFNTMFPEFDKVQIRNVYRLRALAR